MRRYTNPIVLLWGAGGGACLTLILCFIFHFFGFIQYSNIYFYIYDNIILFTNLFLILTCLSIYIISNYYYNNLKPRIFYYKANNILNDKIAEVTTTIDNSRNSISFNVIHNEHNKISTNAIVRDNTINEILIYNNQYCFLYYRNSNRKFLFKNIDPTNIPYGDQAELNTILSLLILNKNIKILDSMDIIYENDYIINIISSFNSFILNAISIIIPIISSIIVNSIISK